MIFGILFRNRDGNLIHSFNTETVIKLLSVESRFVQYSALQEILSRLLYSIRPKMEYMPSGYKHTTIAVTRNYMINTRGYLSPSCLYLYSQNKSGLLCERLDYRVMDITQSGDELILIPHSNL